MATPMSCWSDQPNTELGAVPLGHLAQHCELNPRGMKGSMELEKNAEKSSENLIATDTDFTFTALTITRIDRCKPWASR